MWSINTSETPGDNSDPEQGVLSAPRLLQDVTCCLSMEGQADELAAFRGPNLPAAVRRMSLPGPGLSRWGRAQRLQADATGNLQLLHTSEESQVRQEQTAHEQKDVDEGGKSSPPPQWVSQRTVASLTIDKDIFTYVLKKRLDNSWQATRY